MIHFRDFVISPEILKNDFTEFLRRELKDNDITFFVPEDITDNKEKQTYRVGFLAELTKRIYPEKNQLEICKILEEDHQVYLSRRQIDRHVKKFQENYY